MKTFSGRLARALLAYCVILATTAGCFGIGAAPLVPSTVDTSVFDGTYTLDPEASFPSLYKESENAQSGSDRQTKVLLAMFVEQYKNSRIANGVIRSGTILRQEFSLVSATTENAVLHGRAIWHEDVGDPGDENEILVTLRLDGDILEFYIYDSDDQMGDPIILTRTSRTNGNVDY